VNLVENLARQFAYDEWANREVLTAWRQQGADARSLDLVAHVIGAEILWMDRLKQQPQSSAVWPQTDLAACEAQAVDLGRRLEGIPRTDDRRRSREHRLL